MLPTNSLRLIQNTIDSTQSHNQRIHVDKLWNQREIQNNHRKKKRKRPNIFKGDDCDKNWHKMQKIRKQNAKKRKTNLEGIVLGKWGHDKFDKMDKTNNKQTNKTLFDALQSLKPKPIILSDNDSEQSEQDIDLTKRSKIWQKKSKHSMVINLKSSKPSQTNKESDKKRKSKKKKKHKKMKKRLQRRKSNDYDSDSDFSSDRDYDYKRKHKTKRKRGKK